MKDLITVKWYAKTAVYLDGKLLTVAGHPGIWSPVLEHLGYRVREFCEIPTHDIPVEFDRDANDHWKPPEVFDILLEQVATWQERVRREQISRTVGELERLRIEPLAYTRFKLP